MTNKELIIHLIREELRNKRLMHSLEQLGFDCSFYTLQICHIILEKAGFKERTDELYEWYLELIIEVLNRTPVWNSEEILDRWSKYVYAEVLKKKMLYKKW